MPAMLAVENVTVAYGRGKRKCTAVQEVSFYVEQGECVGFIGANGAGKSTTIKAIMGFLHPESGRITLCGHPAGSTASRQQVGYLPEVAVYYPFMRARELLTLYGSLSGMRKAELQSRIPEVLDMVGLSGKDHDLLRTFSKGMQQRLGIAQAMIAKPELLILDEVSSGLDPLGRHDLRALLTRLKAEGSTLFFSSHELSEVESLCDRVLLINQGRLLRSITRDELHAVGRERSLESFFIESVRAGD